MGTKTEGDAMVVFVKFTAKYNEAAHRLLADNDPPFSPKPHACIRVTGDMFMILMQYVPPSKGEVLVNTFLALLKHCTKDTLFSETSENVLNSSNVYFDDVDFYGTDRCSIYLHPHTTGTHNVKGMQIMDRS